MATWYEDTPTVWDMDGATIYINCEDKMMPKGGAANAWKNRAGDGFPVFYTRRYVQRILADIPQEDIDAMRLIPTTIDWDPPVNGNAQEKIDAVREKLSTLVPVTDFDKIQAYLDAKAAVDPEIAVVK